MRLTLRAARERTTLTPEGLAEKAGVHRATVYRIEAGEIVNPSNDTVASLEEALELPRGTLVFGQEAADAATPPTPDEPSPEPSDLTVDAIRSGR